MSTYIMQNATPLLYYKQDVTVNKKVALSKDIMVFP